MRLFLHYEMFILSQASGEEDKQRGQHFKAASTKTLFSGRDNMGTRYVWFDGVCVRMDYGLLVQRSGRKKITLQILFSLLRRAMANNQNACLDSWLWLQTAHHDLNQLLREVSLTIYWRHAPFLISNLYVRRTERVVQSRTLTPIFIHKKEKPSVTEYMPLGKHIRAPRVFCILRSHEDIVHYNYPLILTEPVNFTRYHHTIQNGPCSQWAHFVPHRQSCKSSRVYLRSSRSCGLSRSYRVRRGCVESTGSHNYDCLVLHLTEQTQQSKRYPQRSGKVCAHCENKAQVVWREGYFFTYISHRIRLRLLSIPSCWNAVHCYCLSSGRDFGMPIDVCWVLGT